MRHRISIRGSVRPSHPSVRRSDTPLLIIAQMTHCVACLGLLGLWRNCLSVSDAPVQQGYPSRLQVDRGRICGHLIIWAGAVRQKTTKTNKKLMCDREILPGPNSTRCTTVRRILFSLAYCYQEQHFNSFALFRTKHLYLYVKNQL